jgi:5-formyltetrahydrofolate cyclo-ligase
VADEKKYLRSVFAETRRALARNHVENSSARVQARLLGLQVYSDFHSDFCATVLYASKDNEVLTSQVAADALETGRALFYPRLSKNSGSLALVRVADLTDLGELKAGAFGIPEPDGPSVDFDQLLDQFTNVLVCVPGVAFSVSGQRIGRGGGHYDRLLSELGDAVTTVGLAYSFQVLDSLPQSPGDRRLDFIVTESTTHVCRPVLGRSSDAVEEGGVPKWR